MKITIFSLEILQKLFPEQLENIPSPAKGARATKRQTGALWHFRISPSGMSAEVADLVIAFCDYRQSRRLASLEQVSKLRFLGHPNATDLTAREAHAVISAADAQDSAKGVQQ